MQYPKYLERNILTWWFPKVKQISAVGLEFCSKCPKLKMQCEKFTLFWSCGTDCKDEKAMMRDRYFGNSHPVENNKWEMKQVKTVHKAKQVPRL